MEPQASRTSVAIKTTAKGQKQIDIKMYEPEDISRPFDLARETVQLMQRVEAECLAAHYTLVGS